MLCKGKLQQNFSNKKIVYIVYIIYGFEHKLSNEPMRKNTYHAYFNLQNTVGKMQLLRVQCARKLGFGNTVLQSKYNESLIHCRQVFREHSQQNLLSLKSNDSTTKRCKHKANLIKTNHSEDSGV